MSKYEAVFFNSDNVSVVSCDCDSIEEAYAFKRGFMSGRSFSGNIAWFNIVENGENVAVVEVTGD